MTPLPEIAPVLLERIDPERNMQRFYRLELQPSLFGEIGVVRSWGRIGARGQTRTDWHAAPDIAVTAMHKLIGIKQRRGYGPSRQHQKTLPNRNK